MKDGCIRKPKLHVQLIAKIYIMATFRKKVDLDLSTCCYMRLFSSAIVSKKDERKRLFMALL